MKEVTYEDWIKNPVPRMMWVWDSSENNKKQRKVIYVLKDDYCTYPVMAVTDECMYENYWHCAEIEEPKTRRMTHKELAHWLKEKPFREFRYGNSTHCPIYSYHTYTEAEASKEVDKNTVIREDDGEWKEPLIEEIE